MFSYHRTQDWTKVCLYMQLSSQANLCLYVLYWQFKKKSSHELDRYVKDNEILNSSTAQSSAVVDSFLVCFQGLKLLTVMSRLQVEFTMLKGLFNNESRASRCQLVTTATEFFLNSGSIEGALKMLKGNSMHSYDEPWADFLD